MLNSPVSSQYDVLFSSLPVSVVHTTALGGRKPTRGYGEKKYNIKIFHFISHPHLIFPVRNSKLVQHKPEFC